MQTNSPPDVVLDTTGFNARLIEGRQLAITEVGGEVVRCTVVSLGEQVPPEIFDDYLARGLIQEMDHGGRFRISSDGRKRLR
jgi:hypothetical protein